MSLDAISNTGSDEPVEAERLRFDHERVRLERQKLAIETRLKRRELSSGRNKTYVDRLTNPLSLAIIGGSLTLVTSIATTTWSAYENRVAAKQALEAELIKKFVEGPTDTVRENLQFLMDANLLPDYALGIGAYLKDNPLAAPSVGASVVAPTPQFLTQAPQVMRSLISDFGLTEAQAAGIVGNLSYETTGFRELEEINPPGGGRGGIGYAKWTGARRVEFEKFVQSNSLDPLSREASYSFLKQELQTTQNRALAAVKQANSLEEATFTFQNLFERPNALYANSDSRVKWAQLALKIFHVSAKTNAP